MYNISQLKELLKDKKMDEKFSSIYGGDSESIKEAYSRLTETIKHFEGIEKNTRKYMYSVLQEEQNFQEIILIIITAVYLPHL